MEINNNVLMAVILNYLTKLSPVKLIIEIIRSACFIIIKLLE